MLTKQTEEECPTFGDDVSFTLPSALLDAGMAPGSQVALFAISH